MTLFRVDKVNKCCWCEEQKLELTSIKQQSQGLKHLLIKQCQQGNANPNRKTLEKKKKKTDQGKA